MKKIFFSFFLVFLFSACASNREYLSKDIALNNPVEGISISHPDYIEKEGGRVITFLAIMDPGLWTEMYGTGGVWPVIAILENGDIKKGKGIFFGKDCELNNLLSIIFIAQNSEEEEKISREGRFLVLSRDGGYAFRIDGKEIKEKGKSQFDPEKFDKDVEYRKELAKKEGWNLSDINIFWEKYFSKKYDYIKKIHPGHEEWLKYKKVIFSVMPYIYKMADGEIRISFLPAEEFRDFATEVPGFTMSERILKNARLPLGALAAMSPTGLIAVGASIAGNIAASATNRGWSGIYARAQAKRFDLALAFRAEHELNQMVIKKCSSN